MTDDSEQERWTEHPSEWDDATLSCALKDDSLTEAMREPVRKEAARRLRGGEGEREPTEPNPIDALIGHRAKQIKRDAERQEWSEGRVVAELWEMVESYANLSPTDGEEGRGAMCRCGHAERDHETRHYKHTCTKVGCECRHYRPADAAPDTEGREPEGDDLICANCGDDIREHLPVEARACFEAYKNDLQALDAPTDGEEGGVDAGLLRNLQSLMVEAVESPVEIHKDWQERFARAVHREADPRPEEVGGEDEGYTDEDLEWAFDILLPDKPPVGDIDKVRDYEEKRTALDCIRDRLRRPPEGAGEGRAGEARGGGAPTQARAPASEVSLQPLVDLVFDAIHGDADPRSGEQAFNEVLRRLRTGRKERDE